MQTDQEKKKVEECDNAFCYLISFIHDTINVNHENEDLHIKEYPLTHFYPQTFS
jgi:hypothetical protein